MFLYMKVGMPVQLKSLNWESHRSPRVFVNTRCRRFRRDADQAPCLRVNTLPERAEW